MGFMTSTWGDIQGHTSNAQVGGGKGGGRKGRGGGGVPTGTLSTIDG